VLRSPDKTTILDFRRLPEKHELNSKILAGAIVDVTIITAPLSAKNSTRQRDPTRARINQCGLEISSTARLHNLRGSRFTS
jgi:hypothetical protein